MKEKPPEVIEVPQESDTLQKVKIKKPRLTKKQKGFIKDYITTGNGTQAALNNYDTNNPRVAQVIASENLSKPIIVKSLQEALPDELLARVHLEGLQATKRSGTGGMLLNTDSGVFGHTDIDEPDYAVRHKYLDSAYKLKGSYAPDKQLTIIAQVGASDRIKQLADRLLAAAHGEILISEGESIQERDNTDQ